MHLSTFYDLFLKFSVGYFMFLNTWYWFQGKFCVLLTVGLG